MKDVMKKRIVGAGVLIIIGILVPLLFVRFFHGGSDGARNKEMRVYEITSDGEARRAKDAPEKTAQNSSPPDRSAAQKEREGVDASVGVDAGKRSAQDRSNVRPQATPQPVSPRSAPQGNGGDEMQAPPVQGNRARTNAEPQPAAAEQLNGRQAPQRASKPGTEAAAGNESGSLQRNAASDGWVVQVASFGDKANAERLARELKDEFNAFYRAGDVKGKTYYRVRVGPFDSETAARAAAGRLRQSGRSTLVQHAG